MIMMSKTGVMKILKSLEKGTIEIKKPNVEIALMMMSRTEVLKTLQHLEKAFAFSKPLISLCSAFPKPLLSLCLAFA